MNLGKTLFWIVSRSGTLLYSRFPLFGPLSAAMGVIQKDGAILMIERNDGRGISFPGGLLLPWENPERALVREILEETGLQVTKTAFKFQYHSSADIPVKVTVFDVEAEGQLRGSWEGTPHWMQRPELPERIIPAQRRIVEALG